MPLPTPYYNQDGITIYHGDCTDGFGDILHSCEILITDPPYGIQHSSSHGASWQNTNIQGDTDTSLRDYICDEFLIAAVFGSWKAPKIADARACLVWDKGPQFGMGDLTFPWKPSFEFIYIKGDGWAGRRDEGVLRVNGHISWETKGRAHPHEKPVHLLRQLIEKAQPGPVIDPFCGTGSTLQAAKLIGRCAIGIEIEERYCEIAAKRLSQQVLTF
jgi:site-specific DNA-methyltransferase (adenine-specific)